MSDAEHASMTEEVSSTYLPSGPLQAKAYIEALYFALLDRPPDPLALLAETSAVDLQHMIRDITKSDEFGQRWPESGVWGNSALHDLLRREGNGDWTAGEWVAVLAGLFVALSRRCQSTRDQLPLQQKELALLIKAAGEENNTAYREELARSIREFESKANRERVAKNDRLSKEHIALSRRLASIEERIYQKPDLDVEGCKSYAVTPNLMLVRSRYGSFLVIRPDLIGGALGRGEFWDTHIKSAIDRYSDMDRIAIDAGAFIGFHSVYLASKFKKVYAFEPQKFVWRLAVGNLALNNVVNAEMLNAALYSADSSLALAEADQQQIPVPMQGVDIDYSLIGNAAAVSFSEGKPSSNYEVPAHKLDSLGIKDVGFIKIDVQGCDLHVLRGAIETIKRDRPVITFEFEEKLSAFHGSNWVDYVDFFKECQYSVSEIAHSGPDQWDYIAVPQN